MKNFQLFSLVVAVSVVAGCGDDGRHADVAGDESGIQDVATDVGQDVAVKDSGQDESADAGDGLNDGDDDASADVVDATDAAGDVPADTFQPDAAFVWEVRNRQGCVADGPWKVDRVVRFGAWTEGLGEVAVTAAVVAGGRVWLFAGGRLVTATDAELLAGGGFVDVTEELQDQNIILIRADGTNLLVATGAGIETFDVNAINGMLLPIPMEYRDIVRCGQSLWAVAGGVLYEMAGEPIDIGLSALTGAVCCLACVDETLVIGAENGVFAGDRPETISQRWMAGDNEINAIAAGGGLVAASVGIGLVLMDTTDWNSAYIEPGIGGLPTGRLHGVAVSAQDHRVAIAHEVGCSVLDLAPSVADSLAVNRIQVGGHGQGVVDHFNSARWLPSDEVAQVAFDPLGDAMWVATGAGASRIRSQQIDLADKAAEMMDNLDRWFWRLEGFVTAEAAFESAVSDVRLQLRDNDNDGQWTQEAVGAFCYAYRVTGDERYYQAARKAITNMCMLIDVPAQDFIDAGLGRGFVTRSFVRDDEGELFTQKAALPNWHLVDYMDGHQYYWKDDTSSDEMTGHFYGFSIYHDLCAKDDTERAWVAEHLTALVSYIVTHGYRLLDLDGQPTEHGKYSPEYLAVAVDGLEACTLTYDMETCIGAWGGGAFLDSTEILGGLLAAWHVSGDRRFYAAYESLISEHRYDELATFNEFVMTWTNPQVANYCDHELSDLALLTLIRYEQRPDRRAIWIKSMLDAWQYETGERNPLKTLAMAAALAEIDGVDGGVSTLIDFPEDQRDYPYDNSHRVDAGRMGKDRFGKPQFDTVFAYDEIHTMRWDGNPYRTIGGGSAIERRAPNFWLLPYWGLRYYGVICDSE